MPNDDNKGVKGTIYKRNKPVHDYDSLDFSYDKEISDNYNVFESDNGFVLYYSYVKDGKGYVKMIEFDVNGIEIEMEEYIINDFIKDDEVLDDIHVHMLYYKEYRMMFSVCLNVIEGSSGVLKERMITYNSSVELCCKIGHEMENKVKEMENVIKEKENIINEISLKLENVENENIKIKGELEKAQNEVNELSIKLKKANDEITLLNEELELEVKQNNKLNGEIEELNKEIKMIEEELSLSHNDNKVLQGKLDDSIQQIDMLSIQLNECNYNVNNLTKQLEDAHNEIETLKQNQKQIIVVEGGECIVESDCQSECLSCIAYKCVNNGNCAKEIDDEFISTVTNGWKKIISKDINIMYDQMCISGYTEDTQKTMGVQLKIESCNILRMSNTLNNEPQKWKFTYNDELKAFKIASYTENYCLGVDKTALIKRECDGLESHQWWDIIDVGDGYYYIKNVWSGKYIDVYEKVGRMEEIPSNHVYTLDFSGRDSQRFKFGSGNEI